MYKEGTQVHGFRDFGLCVDMTYYHWNIGKMEFWNIGYNFIEIKKLRSILFFCFFGLFPLFRCSIIPSFP